MSYLLHHLSVLSAIRRLQTSLVYFFCSLQTSRYAICCDASLENESNFPHFLFLSIQSSTSWASLPEIYDWRLKKWSHNLNHGDKNCAIKLNGIARFLNSCTDVCIISLEIISFKTVMADKSKNGTMEDTTGCVLDYMYCKQMSKRWLTMQLFWFSLTTFKARQYLWDAIYRLSCSCFDLISVICVFMDVS